MFFGKKKCQGVCDGHYTGEGVMDASRFNERGGKTNEVGGVQIEVYGLVKGTHAKGNMRYPVYEYEVNGVIYRRAKKHVQYNIGAVEKMAGKPCKVYYSLDDPGESKAK